VIPPLVIFGTLYLLLAALVFRMPANRWVAGIAGALALGGILSNIPFLVEDLSHPSSWGSFVPNGIAVVAGLGAAFAAVMSYRARSVDLIRPTSMVLAAISAAVVVLSGVLMVTGSSDEPKMGDVRFAAEAFKYPEALTAPSESSDSTWKTRTPSTTPS
jgi:peptidoglycan/LPS O-acetylase OafA/YrhL